MTLDPAGERLSQPALENIEAISEGFQRGETNAQIQARIRAINKQAGRLNRKRDNGIGIRDVFLSATLRSLRLGVLRDGFDPNDSADDVRARFEETTGQQISNTELRNAINRLKGGDPTPPDQRFTNNDKSPDPTRAPLSKGPILRRFSYQVGIVNTKTGEIMGGVTVSSNTRRTKNNIIREASSSIGAVGVDQYTDEIFGDLDSDDFELQLLSSLEASETIL